MKRMVFIVAGFFAFLVVAFIAVASLLAPQSRPADQWHAESWMQQDEELPQDVPKRILSLTDLPPLKTPPKPEDFAVAISKSREAGCNGAVLSHSWPSLELGPDELTLQDLKGAVVANKGRVLFLGIQVLNTTVKDLPSDLLGTSFDDPRMIKRFNQLLDGLAPLLKNRVRFLSIGNETDIYLSIHPDELEPFHIFLDAARKHAKEISPSLVVGTTLTDAGATNAELKQLVRDMDAHMLTYYHGQHGVNGEFKDTAQTKDAILKLASNLDDRPIVFQEVGFPAHESIGSPEKQAEFVNGVFDAWNELGDRVPMLNYFMMYDFPKGLVKDQVNYYGVTEEAETLVAFLTSLGLHEVDGTPRPAWEVFRRRASNTMQPEN